LRERSFEDVHASRETDDLLFQLGTSFALPRQLRLELSQAVLESLLLFFRNVRLFSRGRTLVQNTC
jgi:hypothetical protein